MRWSQLKTNLEALRAPALRKRVGLHQARYRRHFNVTSGMTHKQWHATVRKSLARVERNPARALKSLDALLSRVQREELRHVGSWHLEQTAETISIVQSHLRNHRESAESMLQLADRHMQQLTYCSRAFVAACATAALELASAGDRRGAKRALRRAEAISAGLRPRERLFQQAERVVRRM